MAKKNKTRVWVRWTSVDTSVITLIARVLQDYTSKNKSKYANSEKKIRVTVARV
jgi:hypothetical protein